MGSKVRKDCRLIRAHARILVRLVYIVVSTAVMVQISVLLFLVSSLTIMELYAATVMNLGLIVSSRAYHSPSSRQLAKETKVDAGVMGQREL